MDVALAARRGSGRDRGEQPKLDADLAVRVLSSQSAAEIEPHGVVQIAAASIRDLSRMRPNTLPSPHFCANQTPLPP
jgi:hypothetical protein